MSQYWQEDSTISRIFSGKVINQTFVDADWKSEERQGWDYKHKFMSYL